MSYPEVRIHLKGGLQLFNRGVVLPRLIQKHSQQSVDDQIEGVQFFGSLSFGERLIVATEVRQEMRVPQMSPGKVAVEQNSAQSLFLCAKPVPFVIKLYP